MVLTNDGVNDTIMDVKIVSFKDVYDLRSEFVLLFTDDKHTKNSRTEFLRTSLNMSKVFEGFRGNILLKAILDPFVNALDFELKMPLVAREYALRKVVVPSRLLPPLSTSFIVDFNSWVRLFPFTKKVSRKMVQGSTFTAYGKLN